MKVVVAPDDYKGALAASDAARAIADGVRSAAPDADIVVLPVADGGDGTAETLARATGGRMVDAAAHDALGRPLRAELAITGDGAAAIIEMAQASGLALLPPGERRATEASTYGTGELIRAALDAGVNRLIVAIGGSATSDGGAGMAQALGARFLDGAGKELPPGGAALACLEHIDTGGLDERLRGVEVLVACDVDNPLTGPDGAAHVYGPQKGATPEEVRILDAALERYAAVIRRDLGVDVRELPGAGAAGGLGAGLVAFLGARLEPGSDMVLDLLDFDAAVADADLVITGEGRADAQTARGKAPAAVARRAARHGVPVVMLAGRIGEGAEVLEDLGVTVLMALSADEEDIGVAMAATAERLERAACEVSRSSVALKPRDPAADT